MNFSTSDRPAWLLESVVSWQNWIILSYANLLQAFKMTLASTCGETYESLPELAAKFYAVGITEGLTYMHRRHIVYHNIKPENVLLDKYGYAIIVDLGFGVHLNVCIPFNFPMEIFLLRITFCLSILNLTAKSVSDKMYMFCGMPWYLAPEVFSVKATIMQWITGCSDALFMKCFSKQCHFTRKVSIKKVSSATLPMDIRISQENPNYLKKLWEEFTTSQIRDTLEVWVQRLKKKYLSW
ncbi:hypothetical protein ACHAW6_012295 [Cyclotella cf. meneghiniana]